jgi:phosphopentomutase
MNNFIIIILDGVGIGELPDAYLYKDEGSNTLVNIAREVDGLNLPILQSLGLGNISKIMGINKVDKPKASFGKLKEISNGKDSTTGHWEIGGLYVDLDFSYFPQGFPHEMIEKFLKLTKCKGILGNKAASGTEIIQELGDEHVKTGFPIIYTSADSVFQIAAHEEIIPLKRLYEICEVSRNEVITAPTIIGRVIARPFIGTSGNYSRTVNRKDFSMNPPGDTILDVLSKNSINTVGIGKVNDLFNYRGIKTVKKTKSNEEGFFKILEYAKKANESLIFANLVDFDVYYGHRNDSQGFANELRKFDTMLPQLLEVLDESDALVIAADHGNDPTTPSTDHSREYVPLIFYRKNKVGKNLGIRETFSDIAKTATNFFGVINSLKGKSFLNE